MMNTLRHVEVTDYTPIIEVIDDWWGGRPMAGMLHRLFFEHFQPTNAARSTRSLSTEAAAHAQTSASRSATRRAALTSATCARVKGLNDQAKTPTRVAARNRRPPANATAHGSSLATTSAAA